MKKTKNIIRFAAFAAVALLAAACSSDDELMGDETAVGTPISFIGSTDDAATRVSYRLPGTVSSTSWDIRWNSENYIYIYSPQASLKEKTDNGYTDVKRYAYYERKSLENSYMTVNLEPNTSTNALNNTATTATGICWGDSKTEHTFYSFVYNKNTSGSGISLVDTNSESSYVSGRKEGSVLKFTFQSPQTDAVTYLNGYYYNNDATTYPFILYGTSAATMPNRTNVTINYKNLATVFDINLKFTSSIEAQLQSSLTVTGIEAYIRSTTATDDKYLFRILGGDFYVDLEKPDAPLVLVGNDHNTSYSGLSEDNSLPTVAKVNVYFNTAPVTLNADSAKLNTKIFLPLTEKVTASSEIVIIGITVSNHYTAQTGTYYLPLTLKSNITPGEIVPINLTYDATKDEFIAVANNFISAIATEGSYFTMMDWGDLD